MIIKVKKLMKYLDMKDRSFIYFDFFPRAALNKNA